MKIKFLLVITAFIVCIALVVIIKQASGERHRLSQVDFYESMQDWADFKIENLQQNEDQQQLLIVDSKLPGEITSPAIKTKYDFDEILLSWNCHVDPPGGLFVILSVSADSINWQDFGYQLWGGLDPDSVGFNCYPKTIDRVGEVDEDIIRLEKPMRYYRFDATMYAGETGWFSFDRISVCYSKLKASPALYSKFRPHEEEIRPVALAVPFKSQDWLPDSIAGLTCSPTSVTMVMNYHGFDYTTMEVAAAVYDPYNDIYGNWPYNAEAAYQLGLNKCWIGRHNSFKELARELNDGIPVVISIAVGEGQKITGAPYKHTQGHLIVVRGFDDEGRVLVNDPAADNAEDGMLAYDMDELTDAWVNHQGVAYHLWPRSYAPLP